MAMKVVKLRRMEKYPDKNLYSFNLSLEGFLINGFVFNADTGSVLPPARLNKNGRKVPLVKAFGIHWKRLQKLVQQEIEGLYTCN